MKRVIKLTSILLCFLIIIIGLSSCKKGKFDINENNELFVYKYTNHHEDTSIEALTIYYYESYFYYDVEAVSEKKNETYHFLYVFRYKQYQIYYSIKYPEKDLEYYPQSYFRYLEAKEKGKSRTYTEEEIKELMNS